MQLATSTRLCLGLSQYSWVTVYSQLHCLWLSYSIWSVTLFAAGLQYIVSYIVCSWVTVYSQLHCLWLSYSIWSVTLFVARLQYLASYVVCGWVTVYSQLHCLALKLVEL